MLIRAMFLSGTPVGLSTVKAAVAGFSVNGVNDSCDFYSLLGTRGRIIFSVNTADWPGVQWGIL